MSLSACCDNIEFCREYTYKTNLFEFSNEFDNFLSDLEVNDGRKPKFSLFLMKSAIKCYNGAEALK